MVLIQQIINGVMLGSSYSLIAIGYTLVFGVLHLVHLAHGEVFMIGAFVGLQVVLLAGGGVAAAIPAAAVSAALVGVLVYLVAIKPITGPKGPFPRADDLNHRRRRRAAGTGDPLLRRRTGRLSRCRWTATSGTSGASR